jgi:hypothetical protein
MTPSCGSAVDRVERENFVTQAGRSLPNQSATTLFLYLRDSVDHHQVMIVDNGQEVADRTEGFCSSAALRHHGLLQERRSHRHGFFGASSATHGELAWVNSGDRGIAPMEKFTSPAA